MCNRINITLALWDDEDDHIDDPNRIGGPAPIIPLTAVFLITANLLQKMPRLHGLVVIIWNEGPLLQVDWIPQQLRDVLEDHSALTNLRFERKLMINEQCEAISFITSCLTRNELELAFRATRNEFHPRVMTGCKREMVNAMVELSDRGLAGLSVIFDTLRERNDWSTLP